MIILYIYTLLHVCKKILNMRVVVQRVSEAALKIDDKVHSEMGWGLVVLLGIENKDDGNDIEWLCNKLINLRIFSDDEGKMNRSVREINGDILVVSQFTLHASTKKGNRPSFIKAARPEKAITLDEKFMDTLSVMLGKRVKDGVFGAYMKIHLVNDGPVTITIDTLNKE